MPLTVSPSNNKITQQQHYLLLLEHLFVSRVNVHPELQLHQPNPCNVLKMEHQFQHLLLSLKTCEFVPKHEHQHE